MAAKARAKTQPLAEPCDHVLTVLAAMEVGVSIRHAGEVAFSCAWHNEEIKYADALAWVERNGYPDRIRRDPVDT